MIFVSVKIELSTHWSIYTGRGLGGGDFVVCTGRDAIIFTILLYDVRFILSFHRLKWLSSKDFICCISLLHQPPCFFTIV